MRATRSARIHSPHATLSFAAAISTARTRSPPPPPPLLHLLRPPPPPLPSTQPAFSCRRPYAMRISSPSRYCPCRHTRKHVEAGAAQYHGEQHQHQQPKRVGTEPYLVVECSVRRKVKGGIARASHVTRHTSHDTAVMETTAGAHLDHVFHSHAASAESDCVGCRCYGQAEREACGQRDRQHEQQRVLAGGHRQPPHQGQQNGGRRHVGVELGEGCSACAEQRDDRHGRQVCDALHAICNPKAKTAVFETQADGKAAAQQEAYVPGEPAAA